MLSKPVSFLISLVCLLTWNKLYSQNDYIKNDSSIFSTVEISNSIYNHDWNRFIVQNSIPIKSITDSTDFSDLEFFRTIIADKKYVFLGESSHLIEEYSQIKTRIIKYLTQKLGFRVIVFESNLWDCYQIEVLKDSLSAREILSQTVYGVWHTATLEKLLDYIVKSSIKMAGMDIMPSAYSYSSYFENKILPDYDSVMAIKSDELNLSFRFLTRAYFTDSKILKAITYSDRLDSTISGLVELNNYFTPLVSANCSDLLLKVYQKEIINRINLLTAIHDNKYSEYMDIRDSLMAATITWLIREVYKDEKIIFWAHNDHISKNDIGNMKRNPIVYYLPDSIKAKTYNIGLFVYSGKTYTNKPVLIRKPKKNSLEALFIQPHYKYSFIDISKLIYSKETSWAFQELIVYQWGRFKRRINLSKTFDGIIFIDNATLPNHYVIDLQ